MNDQFTLPKKTESLLIILHNEIKSRKISTSLNAAGLEASILTSDNSAYIFDYFELPTIDEIFSWYLSSIDRICKYIDVNQKGSIDKAVIQLYEELSHKKRSLIC